MPSSKRAKLSYPRPQAEGPRTFAHGHGSADFVDDSNADEQIREEEEVDGEEEVDHEEVEVEEVIEEFEEEERDADGVGESHENGTDQGDGDEIARRVTAADEEEDVENADDEVNRGEEEGGEEYEGEDGEDEEEIEEIEVVEEEDEEEYREAGTGEEDREEEETEEGNGTEGSESEPLEDGGSIENSDSASLQRSEGDVDEGDSPADSPVATVDNFDVARKCTGSACEKYDDGYRDDDDDNDDDNDDDDDDGTSGEKSGHEDEDEENYRKKQLAVLMCFTSLQSLMATELCRDTTPPYDEISSTTTSSSFLKLILLAITGIMQEDGQQHMKLDQTSRHVENEVGSFEGSSHEIIFRRKYGMSYSCFLYLVEELRPLIQSKIQMYVKGPIQTEHAVAIVLYRLAHGLSAREVAEKYNVGVSTVGRCTHIITSALSNGLYGRFVAIPTGDRIARIISGFQQITNVAQMCGAIDVTHIKLHAKPDNWYDGSVYRSSHHGNSILLQAVCDADKIFWDVWCSTPSSGHKAVQFISSDLHQKVKDGLSLQEPLLKLENRDISPFMVGDNAYPLRPFLIKPFETSDPLRKAFDEHLQKGLACIHNAFAILKSRWKILKMINVNPKHGPQIAIACCVLHNICQSWGEPEPCHELVEGHADEQSQGYATAYEIDEAARVAGEAARESLFRDWVKRSLDNAYGPYDQEN